MAAERHELEPQAGWSGSGSLMTRIQVAEEGGAVVLQIETVLVFSAPGGVLVVEVAVVVGILQAVLLRIRREV